MGNDHLWQHGTIDTESNWFGINVDGSSAFVRFTNLVLNIGASSARARGLLQRLSVITESDLQGITAAQNDASSECWVNTNYVHTWSDWQYMSVLLHEAKHCEQGGGKVDNAIVDWVFDEMGFNGHFAEENRFTCGSQNCQNTSQTICISG